MKRGGKIRPPKSKISGDVGKIEIRRPGVRLADSLLDSDIVIWHLRGRSSVVEKVLSLAQSSRLAVSVITRAEVLLGMREPERRPTLGFLDACETLAVDAATADRAAALIRDFRSRGVTMALPDGLIAATALHCGIPLYSCNSRHFSIPGLDLRSVVP